MRTRLLTVMLTGLVTALVFTAMTPVARASADYTSFFSQRDLAEAGWSACGSVTWSVDVTGMTSGQARGEIRRLKQAWQAWSSVSGLVVSFSGRERLDFDPATNGLTPLEATPRSDRHVLIAFKARNQVPIMASNAVGLAMPTVVMMPTQEIVAGMAIFRRGYVKEQARVAPDRLVNLYLHEIGHILGLGHAVGAGQVMHPTLQETTGLGDGDRAGISALTRPCPSV